MSRLWSPQMRKWARDRNRHGHPIGLYRLPKQDGGAAGASGGGTQLNFLTDDIPINYLTSDDLAYMLTAGIPNLD